MNVSTAIVALPYEPDHPVFQGHFPGNPIIPGVQLLDRVKRILEAQNELVLMGLLNAKFLSPAGPGDELELEYTLADGQVRFEIRCAERKVASGQFLISSPG